MATVKKGENDDTGFKYQLETLLFWMNHLQKQEKRITKFNIGSAVQGQQITSKTQHAFDDVVLDAELETGKKFTIMVQVKHSKHMIDSNYLCNNPKTFVLKYFKSFLTIKKFIKLDEIAELVLWTNMCIAQNISKDWFEPYTPSADTDILRDNEIVKQRRFRIKEDPFMQLAKNFLDIVHPRTALIEKFVDVLFKKEEWSSHRAAANYHQIMAIEIIDCDGPNSKFKRNFIDGKILLPETAMFRQCFESIMIKRFENMKIGTFAMADLNSEEYSVYFKLKVDANFGKGSQQNVEWNPWTEVANQEDLKDFRKRFVFYVGLPNENAFKTHLVRNVKYFDEIMDLLKLCAFQNMISQNVARSLVDLVDLRHKVVRSPYLRLCFGDLDDLQRKLEPFLTGESKYSFLTIKCLQDVKCTLSRIVNVIERFLAPSPKRYLILSLDNFINNVSKLVQIISHDQLTENGLKYLIITTINPNIKLEQDVKDKLKDMKILAILVTTSASADNSITDEFDISTLSENCKNEIIAKEISFSQHQNSTVAEIIGDAIFQKDNFPLVLELYTKHDTISIDGNTADLDKNFMSRKIKCEENDMYDIIKSKQIFRIILSDQAGTGKSTEMINLAAFLRETYADHLIVYTESINVIKENDITKAICNIMNLNSLALQTLIKCLIQQNKLILLLDGIDEVSDDLREELESFLNKISHMQIFKLVIGTRPRCDKLIRKIFPNCFVCHLPPFSADEQIKYLKGFWNVSDGSKTEEKIKELVSRFSGMLKELIGIPLQTYMIAVIYKESISPEFEIPKPHTIGSIYKQFIYLKFKEVTNRQFNPTIEAHKKAIETLESRLIAEHVNAAAKMYLRSSMLELERLCNRLQPYGIVRLHPSIGFVHYTYFEYFITIYFLSYTTNSSKAFHSFMKQNLCSSRLSIATKFLDHHINEIDPKQKLELLDDSPVDEKCNEYETFAGARLHPEKMQEFNHYLCQLPKSEVYTLLRNTLNLSVFNVFEVLYDSLPLDIRSSLKFSFGNKIEENFINLKLLGANQMLQLLNILVKKNPDNFVSRYLTDFFDEDEDYLEVACRKPFVQVLIWMVEDLIPKINDHERQVLHNYVDRRFEKYFELIIQHNNNLFLEESIKRVKHLWPSKQTVYEFLLERNVISVFLKSIEVKCDTKPLLVEERVKMIGNMCDLFNWASNGSVELSQDCTNAIEILEHSAIKSAFKNNFFSH